MKATDEKEIDWFITTLQEQFNLCILSDDIGYEAMELGLDEVEASFVPSELFEEVPATLLYETMIVDDPEGIVWVGAVAYYPHSSEWCLQVITKNDEVVLRKVLPFID
ncbi:hypothetical protein [Metaplanococcus flavidus]|uniref:Uncharacterized protein n=1 Tax=Metaplanococcus flavidus TaxID=569883 RepID=A0ABW3LB55_9BACL